MIGFYIQGSQLESKTEEADKDSKEPEKDKGDPEIAPIFVSKLLPVFAHVYHSTMVHSVRKASFAQIRKMIHYCDNRLLEEIASKNNFASQIVEVIANVLDGDDDDSHMVALHIIADVSKKSKEIFLDNFARLGVLTMVQSLASKSVNNKDVKSNQVIRNKLTNYIS